MTYSLLPNPWLILRLFLESLVHCLKAEAFRLRKWSANHLAKPVLLSIPKCDLGSNIREIDLGSNPMPDSKALGLIWDVEKDCLKVHCNKNLTMPVGLSRREMLRFLAGHFDPLGFIAPYLLGGKLILHRSTCAGIGWDDELPKDMMIDWSAWLVFYGLFQRFRSPATASGRPKPRPAMMKALAISFMGLVMLRMMPCPVWSI